MSDIAKLQDAPSTKIQQQILSLHAYLKSLDLEAGDELPVEEVLARIDAIEWGNEDLVEAGEAFLLFTRLWRLKWALLVDGPKAATAEEVWEIFAGRTQQSTDYSCLERLSEPEAYAIYQEVPEDKLKKSQKRKPTISLEELFERIYEETPREDAEALIDYLGDHTLLLDAVAQELFAGDRVRAFTAGLFAGSQVTMTQESLYGAISINAVRFS
jgi:hypothetical protein